MAEIKKKNPSAIFLHYRCLLAAQLDKNQSINRNVLTFAVRRKEKGFMMDTGIGKNATRKRLDSAFVRKFAKNSAKTGFS